MHKFQIFSNQGDNNYKSKYFGDLKKNWKKLCSSLNDYVDIDQTLNLIKHKLLIPVVHVVLILIANHNISYKL